MKNKGSTSTSTSIVMTKGSWFVFNAAAAAVGLIAVEGVKVTARYVSKKIKESGDEKSAEKAQGKKKVG